jgi:hypothetical protein
MTRAKASAEIACMGGVLDIMKSLCNQPELLAQFNAPTPRHKTRHTAVSMLEGSIWPRAAK